jgi:hypothetical protein
MNKQSLPGIYAEINPATIHHHSPDEKLYSFTGSEVRAATHSDLILRACDSLVL